MMKRANIILLFSVFVPVKCAEQFLALNTEINIQNEAQAINNEE